MSTRAFYEKDFSERTYEIDKAFRDEIEGFNDWYVSNVEEEKLIDSLYEKYSFDTLEIDIKNPTMRTFDKYFPMHEHPHRFGRIDDPYAKVKKKCLEIHYPYTGDIGLLRYKPNPCLIWSVDMEKHADSISFGIVCWNDNDGKSYKSEIDHTGDNLSKQVESLRKNCETFNKELKHKIQVAFQRRKEKVQKESEMIANIGIPLQRKESVPQAFSVPVTATRKKVNVSLPQAKQPTPPDPTISDTMYEEILKTITEVGRSFEKYPSTYVGKGEEALRDLILIFLENNFELSGTAESFNKKGKTDIMLKHLSNIAFIAECKIWKGAKKLKTEDISQLLSYLTWRDTKTAFIIFVRENGMSDILTKIDTAFNDHPNRLTRIGKKGESRFDYKFHLESDKGREVSVAVIAFHLPE